MRVKSGLNLNFSEPGLPENQFSCIKNLFFLSSYPPRTDFLHKTEDPPVFWHFIEQICNEVERIFGFRLTSPVVTSQSWFSRIFPFFLKYCSNLMQFIRILKFGILKVPPIQIQTEKGYNLSFVKHISP
jgi:hypothetical protein